MKKKLNFRYADVRNSYFTSHSMPLVSPSNDGDDYCNTKKKKQKTALKKVLQRKAKLNFALCLKTAPKNVNLRMSVLFHPFLFSVPGRRK
jgi:hypothetical protein